MIPIIVIAVIVVIGIAISFMVRKAMVGNVALEPGEELLYERDGLRLHVQTIRRLHEMRSAFVRVTDRRVFVGTGKLATKRGVISYAVVLDGNAATDFGGGPMTDGFVTFPARRADLVVDGNKLRIPSIEGVASLEVPRWVAVELDTVEVLRAAIVDKLEPPAGTADNYRA